MQKIAYDLSEALSVLHRLNIAHLDLKLDNVIIKDDFSIALIDYGLSDQADAMLSIATGTKCYYPPEVLMCHNYPNTLSYLPVKADTF